jgi:hypothetical protein
VVCFRRSVNVHREVASAGWTAAMHVKMENNCYVAFRDRSVAVGEAKHYMSRSTCEWLSPQIVSSPVACWS